MQIKYIGHSCFEIKGKTLTLVIDPYDPKKTGYKLPKLKADVVLSTHDHDDHNNIKGVSETRFQVTTAGEYEFSDVHIDAIPTFHDKKSGADRGKNTMYQISIDGVNVLHMGDIGHKLTKEIEERLLDIDILLIPVGGTYTIDAGDATEIISSIEPKIVVPMHYQTDDLTGLSKKMDPLKKFLDEMGDQDVQKVDVLKVTNPSSLPEETEVIVIEPAH
jgi:L-ascorbate metabolism protein UlaG (beta-lactamase superfamily)